MLPTGTGRADLKKLRSYQKNDRKVLDHARKLFMATTCSLGLFFMRKDSPQKADYDMFASEALSQAKVDLSSHGMYFLSTVTTQAELMPSYPEECRLTSDDDILFVVRNLLLLLHAFIFSLTKCCYRFSLLLWTYAAKLNRRQGSLSSGNTTFTKFQNLCRIYLTGRS